MPKTIAEINEKIRKGEAVIVDAEEIIDLVEEKGVKKVTEEVDVVTTATFGPMCSSGVYLNIGHSKPKIKLGGGKVYLNNIPVYAGLAAVDIYLGAITPQRPTLQNNWHWQQNFFGGEELAMSSGKGLNIIRLLKEKIMMFPQFQREL